MNEMVKNIDKKKVMVAFLVIVVIIFLLVGGSLLYYNLFNKKDYSEIENIMVNATKEYFDNRKDELPNDYGDVVNVKVSKLVELEYMRSIGDYLKDENTLCEGSVNVTKVSSDYRYVALLDCGDLYSYKNLVDYIKEKEAVVNEGDGLYLINEELVYRGENVNNYVKFAGSTWRIVKVYNNKVMLIYNDKLDRTVWDDRYNKEKENNIGINDFNVSRIYNYLNELYAGDTFLSKNDKLMLSGFDIPFGKISEKDNDKSGASEKANVLTNQYIGLIPVYDYMNASLDDNCNYVSSLSCTNYNYLVKYDYNFWTPIADSKSSYYVYQISYDNGAHLSRASSSGYVRPVITLASDVLYKDGDGSIDNPYTFK